MLNWKLINFYQYITQGVKLIRSKIEAQLVYLCEKIVIIRNVKFLFSIFIEHYFILECYKQQSDYFNKLFFLIKKMLCIALKIK